MSAVPIAISVETFPKAPIAIPGTELDAPPDTLSESVWQLRGIDVTSAGVYRNELVQVFSYPATL